jgi:diguanylate cyclase (GGDEF)-like protein
MKIAARERQSKIFIILIVVLGTALPVLLTLPTKLKLLYLLFVVVFFAAVVSMEKLTVKLVPPATRATVSSLLMIALIMLSGGLSGLPGYAVLLLLPTLLAVLFGERRGMLAILFVATFCWLYLRWDASLPVIDWILSSTLEITPMFVISVCLYASRQQIADLRSRSADFIECDKQTGFLNMPRFVRQLAVDHAAALAANSHYGLLMVDIDGLRKINDSFGYAEGDRVIASVADALRRSIRPDDTVARYGGDEFIVYLAGTDGDTAQEINNLVSQNIYNVTLSVGRKTLRIGAHMGIAVFPDSGKTWEEMLNFADRAMYRDKEFRNRITPTPAPADTGRRQAGVADWKA